MFKAVLLSIGSLVAIFVTAFIYSACVMSSRYNKSDILCENEEENRDLTGLENQSLERLLELYEEDGVNFIINDGKVVDYEVE